jgi:DNA-binding NtrC family response regulator
VVRCAIERTELLRENARLRPEARWLGAPPELVGQSPGMCVVREQIARVAPAEATVLSAAPSASRMARSISSVSTT